MIVEHWRLKISHILKYICNEINYDSLLYLRISMSCRNGTAGLLLQVERNIQLLSIVEIIWASMREKYLLWFASNTGADHSGHLRSLISAFVIVCDKYHV